MKDISPTTPRTLDALAVEVLERMRGQEASADLILGGGVALKHYADFRATHDIDAWWAGPPSERAAALVESAVRETAQAHGYESGVRRWGDTVSYEIRDGRAKVFSFQVSVRDVQLDAPKPSEWLPLRLETLADNVGSKMNALVQRGAPRDFIDIYALIQRGLLTTDDSWELWKRKNPNLDVADAMKSVVRNMVELELRTPLERVPAESREEAKQRRVFFTTIFVEVKQKHGQENR